MSDNRSLQSATSIYTEDDTFRVLARPDIHEMYRLLSIHSRKWTDEGKLYPTPENIRFCKYYGWGWIEYLRAKRQAGLSN